MRARVNFLNPKSFTCYASPTGFHEKYTESNTWGQGAPIAAPYVYEDPEDPEECGRPGTVDLCKHCHTFYVRELERRPPK